jgi:hypothetical protein
VFVCSSALFSHLTPSASFLSPYFYLSIQHQLIPVQNHRYSANLQQIMTTATNIPAQKFKHGDKTESLPVRYDPEGQYYYSSLKDIRYAFDSASQFRVNGSLILFLIDSNGRWYCTLRTTPLPSVLLVRILIFASWRRHKM